MHIATKSAKLKPLSTYSYEGYSDDLSKRLQEHPANLEDLILLQGLMTARLESLKESLTLSVEDASYVERITFGLKMLEQKINITNLFIDHTEARDSKTIEDLKKEVERLNEELFEADSATSRSFEVFFMEAANEFLTPDLYNQLLKITQENMMAIISKQKQNEPNCNPNA